MPRGSDGQVTLPGGTLVNTGDTLLVSQHNPAMQDIAAMLTGSLSRDGLGGMRSDLDMGSHKIENLTPGTNPSDAATVGQLSGGAAGVPVGTVVDFAGSAAPTGWLLCAGQSISRTDFAELFDVIGTTYGSASGSTFNLPDCRGRVTAGRDVDSGGFADRLTTPNSRDMGAAGGAQTHTLTSDQMPSHTHTGSTASAGAHTHTVSAAQVSGDAGIGGGGSSAAPATPTTSSDGAHTHTMNLDNTGGGGAHPNVQPTIVMNRIIRASAT